MKKKVSSPPGHIFIPAGTKRLSDGLWMTETSSGSPTSAMRVMCGLSLIAGIGIAILGMYRCEDLSALAILSSVFVVPAFAGKAVQKHIETRK